MKKKYKNFIKFITLINFLILPAKSDPIFELGKDIFINKAVCSTCHTLVDASAYGQIGPNLNDIRPDKARVISVVNNGIGVMPSYQGELTIEEIEAVAHYVSIAADQ
jgi:mono/diheme cytochrome c family protein|tara:strand:+ start:146 stop:466 length:321 start_codon:yes stop_codon:yes gene_type:complete